MLVLDIPPEGRETCKEDENAHEERDQVAYLYTLCIHGHRGDTGYAQARKVENEGQLARLVGSAPCKPARLLQLVGDA